MTIALSNETKQTFSGRTLKLGEHVVARMELSFTDANGNALPDEIRDCEAYVSRIENDRPSFIAINPYKDRSIAIRQMGLNFVEPGRYLSLWDWTWPESSICTKN